VNIKSQRDFASGLAFLATGIAFAVRAVNHPLGSAMHPGPGFFPLGLGLLLALLGAVLLFKSLAIEAEGGEAIGAIAWRPLLLIVAAVALFGFTLPHLGLVIALPLLVVMVGVAGGEVRWVELGVVAAAVTFVGWGIFVRVLGMPIPLWP